MNSINEGYCRRKDVASLLDLHTVGANKLALSEDDLHFIDHDTDISIVRVESPFGEFWFGNAIGTTSKLAKIALTEMLGQKKTDDKLNEILYGSIRSIMMGSAASVKTVKDAPEGLSIHYGGTREGARVFFTELENINGIRSFAKLAVCNSKNPEASILSLFTKRNVKVSK